MKLRCHVAQPTQQAARQEERISQGFWQRRCERPRRNARSSAARRTRGGGPQGVATEVEAAVQQLAGLGSGTAAHGRGSRLRGPHHTSLAGLLSGRSGG